MYNTHLNMPIKYMKVQRIVQDGPELDYSCECNKQKVNKAVVMITTSMSFPI